MHSIWPMYSMQALYRGSLHRNKNVMHTVIYICNLCCLVCTIAVESDMQPSAQAGKHFNHQTMHANDEQGAMASPKALP